MGARIAAHFANAGFPVDLLDIVLPNQPKRNAAALAGIETDRNQADRSTLPGSKAFDPFKDRPNWWRLARCGGSGRFQAVGIGGGL